MTNQEAKKKVCPLSRLDCLGDRCAVWEWIRTGDNIRTEDGKGYQKVARPKDQWQGRCGFVR